MNLNVHIEQLVLEGLPLERGDGLVLRRAVQQELVRLVAKSRFPASKVVEMAQASPINIASCGAKALGRQIAASVHERITR